MRNKEFRIWDKEENKWYTPIYRGCEGEIYELSLLMDGSLNLREINGTTHESVFPDRYIVEDYIYIKDKNGKKIFEGDILNSKNDGKDGCDIWNYKDHYNKIVRWNDSGYFEGLPEEEGSVHSVKYIEVIGNIHQNPELLESTNE